MKKPERLKRGDAVAIVSTSSGMLGEPWAIHKLKIAKERLENDFGFKVKVMPNALKGIDYLSKHPESRASDLMQAFKDKEVKAIFNAIGGFDSIRLLPYIDFEVIKNNPKIFTGFSDTTSVHFLMSKAGVMSYYGLSVMNNIAEYIKINDYTLAAFKNELLNPVSHYEIKSSPICSYDKDKVWWKEENMNTPRKFYPDEKGYEVLQGTGKVTGRLFGGCVDVFVNLLGTPIWPKLSFFKNKILFLETSEENMSPETLKSILRNLSTQGIFNQIKGILVGKPATEDYYKDYKQVYKQIVGEESNRPDLPIIYNVNIGHAEPITILPIGAKCELDLDNRKITLLESATK